MRRWDCWLLGDGGRLLNLRKETEALISGHFLAVRLVVLVRLLNLRKETEGTFSLIMLNTLLFV